MMFATIGTASACVLLGVVQSVLLSQILPTGIVPDAALVLLVGAAWRFGPTVGELSGFIVGISFDAMSLSPFGFHAFLFTLLGYAFGRLQGNITPGRLLLPCAAVAAATGIKYGGAFLIAAVFGFGFGTDRYFTAGTAVEAAANVILAPAVFWLFDIVVGLVSVRRGGFQR